MPNYTTNLNLEKPLQSEQYNIDIFNANADKIDQFAGQTPARALVADKLTSGAKINGVNFKGDTDIVTGAGFYYDNVTYGAGDLAFIYNQDGALELHKSLNAGNVGHNPLTSTGYWEKQDLGGSGGRNVGEIISSALPLTDAGLHLLDGSRLSGDGIYKGFVDYIAELYTENPTANYFTDETSWQSSVTTYGSCGKFVYDSELNTVRLPKVSDILQCTTNLSALGDLVEAGLPVLNTNTTGAHTHTRGTMDIIGAFNANQLYDSSPVGTGAFTTGGSSSKYTPTSNGDESQSGFNFKASRNWTGATSSNGDHTHTASWTGHTSSTVQPQTIKVLLYIVIATSAKTEIQVDIDEIATDLNGKADVDLSNLTATSSTNFDGQWEYVNTKLMNSVSLNGTTNLTYTLTNIPADGHNYEVLLTGNCGVSATANNVAYLYVSSDKISSEVQMCRFNTRTNNSHTVSSSVILPVSNSRKIYVWRASDNNGTANLWLKGYRRIGTNA